MKRKNTGKHIVSNGEFNVAEAPREVVREEANYEIKYWAGHNGSGHQSLPIF